MRTHGLLAQPDSQRLARSPSEGPSPSVEAEPDPALSKAVSKVAGFRRELFSSDLGFLMEAHNALSAMIVEQTGFQGIWASGFTISATFGLRDCNEVSPTQVLDVVEAMSDATRIPIMLDGDTGYGNYNNFRLLVRKLCQKEVAAVCLEDKLFPKMNSFLGEFQPLADVDEFCGKIKAGKDGQLDDDFCIVARVEALIAGYGVDEALRRAEAYHEAGADGILLHSKSKSPDKVLTFAKEWANRSPLVIVPTAYYATPTDRFRDAQISMVIWANHTLRAALKSMQETCRQIYEDQSLLGVEERIMGMCELFALTGNDRLTEEEQRYLSKRGARVRAVVLAAGRGAKLEELAENKPKCMVDIRGQPLLRRLVSAFNNQGIRDITVVLGYAKEAVDLPAIRTVDNDDYMTTGEAYSLACGMDRLQGTCLISLGHILFRNHILYQLMDAEGDIVLAVDPLWGRRMDVTLAGKQDLALCSRPFTGSYLDTDEVYLDKLDEGTALETAHGRWIGLAKLTDAGCRTVREEIQLMREEGVLEKAELTDLFNRLRGRGQPVRVSYVAGHWLDVNDAFDLASGHYFL